MTFVIRFGHQVKWGTEFPEKEIRTVEIPPGKITESFAAELRRCVLAMQRERARAQGTDRSVTSPSPVWEDALAAFAYVESLGSGDLQNIRYHTSLVTGEALGYWHAYPMPDPQRTAKRLGYIGQTQGVPEEYWISEPPPDAGERSRYAVHYKHVYVNSNVARYQRCVTSLYHSGAIDAMLRSRTRQVVVEVGSGYGGLAYGLGGILRGKATYVCLDFPEMFYFSVSFIRANCPDCSIYVYDPDNYDPADLPRILNNHDFVFLPNYRLGCLEPITDIAVLINMQSFQEMTREQVDEYLGFAVKNVTLCVYSDNQDRHPYNPSSTDVTEQLSATFRLFPDRSYWDEKYKGADLLAYSSYKQYVGVPAGTQLPLPITLPNLALKAPGSRSKGPLFSTGPWKLVRKLLPRRLKRWVRNLLVDE